MKYIEYESFVFSVPNEAERATAEKEIRDCCIHDSFMDPRVNFDYALREGEEVDRHFESGHVLADYAFDLHVDAWSW